MANGGQNSDRKVNAKIQRQKAVKFRLAGATYQAIADQMGCTTSNVHKMVKKEMEQVTKETREDVEQLRAMEVSRLDEAQRAIWNQIANGHLGAVDRLVKISDRRSKLLGLDAPQKTAFTAGVGQDDEEGGVILYIPDNGRPHPGRDSSGEG